MVMCSNREHTNRCIERCLSTARRIPSAVVEGFSNEPLGGEDVHANVSTFKLNERPSIIIGVV